MGDIPTAEEQEQKMADRAREQAEDRVARREKMGHQAVPEPVLEGEDHRATSPDLPSVGSQFVDAQNPETDSVHDDTESLDTSNTADGDAIPPSEEEVDQSEEPHNPAEEAQVDEEGA